MTDMQDKPNPPNSAQRLDELLTTIREALAQDAGTDTRAAAAIACRAILGVLDPSSQTPPAASTSPTVTSPLTGFLEAFSQMRASTSSPSPSTSPIASLLGAFGQIPREQLLLFIGGLRGLLSHQGPSYRTRPLPVPAHPTDGESR